MRGHRATVHPCTQLQQQGGAVGRRLSALRPSSGAQHRTAVNMGIQDHRVERGFSLACCRSIGHDVAAVCQLRLHLVSPFV